MFQKPLKKKKKKKPKMKIKMNLKKKNFYTKKKFVQNLMNFTKISEKKTLFKILFMFRINSFRY